MTATVDWVVKLGDLSIKSCIGLEKAGNSSEMRVHKVNR